MMMFQMISVFRGENDYDKASSRESTTGRRTDLLRPNDNVMVQAKIRGEEKMSGAHDERC